MDENIIPLAIFIVAILITIGKNWSSESQKRTASGKMSKIEKIANSLKLRIKDTMYTGNADRSASLNLWGMLQDDSQMLNKKALSPVREKKIYFTDDGECSKKQFCIKESVVKEKIEKNTEILEKKRDHIPIFSKDNLKNAIILSEIIAVPVSLRHEKKW